MFVNIRHCIECQGQNPWGCLFGMSEADRIVQECASQKPIESGDCLSLILNEVATANSLDLQLLFEKQGAKKVFR